VFIASEWSITETVKQVEKLKYSNFGYYITSDGRQYEELDTQMSKAISDASFAILGCNETRIVEKCKAFSFQNSFRPHPHLWS